MILAGFAVAAVLASGDIANSPAQPPVDSGSATGVLPCKRPVALTAVYRVDGRIRFEGVADASMRGETVRIHDYRTGELVAKTSVGRDGTWWVDSETDGRSYTWVAKFVARIGDSETRWRRLGQAVAIRGRDPVGSGRPRHSDTRTTVMVKVSGQRPELLLVARQTGCSRYQVEDRFAVEADERGYATISLPRPAAGTPFGIYRVRTMNGQKISPPIVVKPVAGE